MKKSLVVLGLMLAANSAFAGGVELLAKGQTLPGFVTAVKAESDAASLVAASVTMASGMFANHTLNVTKQTLADMKMDTAGFMLLLAQDTAVLSCEAVNDPFAAPNFYTCAKVKVTFHIPRK